MGFAGFTASETARRCGPVWRSSWRSKVSSRTEVRVLNLSRHLNSPGGPSLSSAAKAGQFLAYRSTRRNPFARPASARGLLAVFGAKVTSPSLPARPQLFAPPELARRALAVFGASVALRTSPLRRVPWSKHLSRIAFPLAGCYFVAERNDARRRIFAPLRN